MKVHIVKEVTEERLGRQREKKFRVQSVLQNAPVYKKVKIAKIYRRAKHGDLKIDFHSLQIGRGVVRGNRSLRWQR